MRVLIVHNAYRSSAPSGENVVVSTEAALLSTEGVHVELHQPSSDEIADMSLLDRAAVPVRSVWSGPAVQELSRHLQSFRPDIVHVHNTFPLLSPSVLAACGQAGVPVVASLHNFRLGCANGLLLRKGVPCHECIAKRSVLPAVTHGCYRGSRVMTLPVAAGIAIHQRRRTWAEGVTRFVAVSAFVREMVSRMGIPRERIDIKPNTMADPGVSRRQSDGYFFFAGRLAIEKGADLLVEAAERDLEVRIAGDGEEKEALMARSAGRGNVSFLGSLGPAEVAGQIAGAAAVVMPSRFYESFGLTALEAMAVGVPVIAPGHGALPELVEDGVTGLLFQPGSSQDLRRAMETLLADPSSRTFMGDNGRGRYEQRYTPKRNIAQLLDIYRAAMAAAPQGVAT